MLRPQYMRLRAVYIELQSHSSLCPCVGCVLLWIGCATYLIALLSLWLPNVLFMSSWGYVFRLLQCRYLALVLVIHQSVTFSEVFMSMQNGRPDCYRRIFFLPLSWSGNRVAEPYIAKFVWRWGQCAWALNKYGKASQVEWTFISLYAVCAHLQYFSLFCFAYTLYRFCLYD